MKFNKSTAWEYFRDFMLINTGMAVYSLGWAAFLLPYKITTGGMAGMAAILQYATGFPMQVTIFAVNAVLLAIAQWKLGHRFTIKTGYAVMVLSSFRHLVQQIMTDPDGRLIQLLGPGQDSMACVLGATLNGAGIALVFMSGGCTGGWDIIAALVNKYRNISLGRVMLFLDFFVIASCLPIFHDWRMVVFGYVTLAIYSYVLDLIINSSKQDIQLMVFTKHHQAISERVISKSQHSVTVVNGEGFYSHSEVRVLIIVIHKREQIKFLRMIHEIDPGAFITQTRAESVYGNGFNALRA